MEKQTTWYKDKKNITCSARMLVDDFTVRSHLSVQKVSLANITYYYSVTLCGACVDCFCIVLLLSPVFPPRTLIAIILK